MTDMKQEDWKPDVNDVTKVIVHGNQLQRTVVCAANICDGLIVTGARHYDHLMHSQIEALSPEWLAKFRRLRDVEQGFIDQWGNFMDRRTAMKVAIASKRTMRSDNLEPDQELFSEDLY